MPKPKTAHKTAPKGAPLAGQKPPDIKEIMADYDKAVKFFANTSAEAWEGLSVKTK